MASKWLPAAVILTACVFLPCWLSAAEAVTTPAATADSASTTTAGAQITGSERFLRENRDPGQMVGGTSQGVGNMRGQTDAGGQGAGGMFGNQSGFNSSNPFANAFMNSGMSNAMSRQRQQLRVPLRLGPNGVSFTSTIPAVATGPNLRVQNHLARIPHLKSPGSVQVEMVGQIAVLRGAVSSQHERDLVARLVLLEPGIADVRIDELQVTSAVSAPPAVKP
jgi:hypothetical protein